MKNFLTIFIIAIAATIYSAQQTINVGTTANDNTGDSLRNAFIKANANFTELYTADSSLTSSLNTLSAKPFALREARGASFGSMTLRKSVTSLPTVSSGISGATYNQRSGTLFVIRNVSGAAGTIYELTIDGSSVIRTITNSNFIDTEGIEWVGSIRGSGTNTLYDVFLVVEEDHTTAANEASITLCLLTTGATTLDRTATNGTDPDNVTTTTAYSGGTIANSGLEAVAYDPTRSVIYYTAEFQTGASPNTTGTTQANIYTRAITVTSSSLSFGAESTLCSINALFTAGAAGLGVGGDVSDMAYCLQDDTIILQGDVGDRALKIDRSGNLLETLTTTANQPEGVAISPDGCRLWVVGEAQEFYLYETGVSVLTSNTSFILPQGNTLNVGTTTSNGILNVSASGTFGMGLTVNGAGIAANAGVTATSTGTNIRSRSGGASSQSSMAVGRTSDELILGSIANANEQFTGTAAADTVVKNANTAGKMWLGNANALANPVQLSAINRIMHKSVANGNAGTFTLSSGAATVSNTSVTANSVVRFTLKTSSGTPDGTTRVTTLNAGVSFVVAGNAGDNSTYNYIIEDIY